MRILGIDPMDHGALALYDEENQYVSVSDMPVLKISANKYEVDIPQLTEMLRNSQADVAYIEKMQPMPASFGGGFANFKRGAYMYLFRALFTAFAIPYNEVPPRTWMSHFKIKPGKENKNQGYLIASRLFPYIEYKTKKGTLLDGRSDAILIAQFGRHCQHSPHNSGWEESISG
jgi:hypothetical protein